MKSRLTLRLERDVKERAKRLAKQRGTSVSKIVEDYFRILLRGPAGSHEAKGAGTEKNRVEGSSPNGEGVKEEPMGTEDLNTVPDDLPPRTRRMLREVRPATESLDLDEDTRAWVDAAHEKHR